MVASAHATPKTPETRDGSSAPERDAEIAAIHDLFAQLLAAWSRGDGSAYGSLFTEEADYIAFDGSHTIGQQAIAASHQRLFDSWLKGTRLVGQIERLRFLAPHVALVHATGATLMPGKDRPVRPSIQTFVAVKREGSWRFTAFHNTRIVKRSALQWILYGIASKITGR